MSSIVVLPGVPARVTAVSRCVCHAPLLLRAAVLTLLGLCMNVCMYVLPSKVCLLARSRGLHLVQPLGTGWMDRVSVVDLPCLPTCHAVLAAYESRTGQIDCSMGGLGGHGRHVEKATVDGLDATIAPQSSSPLAVLPTKVTRLVLGSSARV